MMSFDDALHEAEIEAACEDLGLDEGTTVFVLASYRRNGDMCLNFEA